MNNGRSLIKKLVGKILNYALLRSNQNRNERTLYEKLKIFAPDISEQYSTTIIDMRDTLLVNRVYCQHAFQVSVVLHSIAHYYYTPKSLQYILDKMDHA